MEKIFDTDRLTKRERVERTLNHLPVDRAVVHDQLSYSPDVIGLYTGRKIEGFNYSIDDICAASRRTLDTCFPPCAPRGMETFTREDGYTIRCDNWTYWVLSRPFNDEKGARDWLIERIATMRKTAFDRDGERARYRDYNSSLQKKLGETVIFDYPAATGLCSVYSDQGMGLELFSYFYDSYPEVFHDFMELFVQQELLKADAIAAEITSPLVLIAEDFATKQGSIFPPDFLRLHHYPYVRMLTEVWHRHGLKVIYHSDGNFRKAIPSLIECGVDGFYCLEPNCGMDIVELKKSWPSMVWAGGVDGVDLLERGTPERVREEVRRQILETNVLSTGGIFIGSSSEINPPIPSSNFTAMIEAVDGLRNPDICGAI